jgi:hypothetical protein
MYICFVLRTIDALKFAFDWEKKLSERGGREWKAEYREKLFRKHHEADLQAYELYTGAHKRKRTEALKKKFIRKHEKVITGRYQLLELYKLVRPFAMALRVAKVF